MSVKKGLGRGFESLIPTDLLDESFDPTASQDEKVSELRQIKIGEIHADPNQPRRQFDEQALAELASSIEKHGILQPIVVTPRQDGGYSIVAGERRYRASLLVGVDKMPALVRTLSGQHRLELSLIENLQRRDLNVLETATAYLKLRDQFNLTLEEIGQRVGNKSVSTISNTLRLLKLPQEVRDILLSGGITEGQARPLIGLDEDTIHHVLPLILKENWSARKIEQFIVNHKKQGTVASETKQKTVAAITHERDIRSLQGKLRTDVAIRSSAKGSGQIIIKFKSNDDFDRIKSLLNI